MHVSNPSAPPTEHGSSSTKGAYSEPTEAEATAETPATATLMCACRRPAKLFTAKTAANPMREFYKCGNPSRQAVKCSCFKDAKVCAVKYPPIPFPHPRRASYANHAHHIFFVGGRRAVSYGYGKIV